MDIHNKGVRKMEEIANKDWKDFFDLIPCGIIITDKNILLYINPTALHLFQSLEIYDNVDIVKLLLTGKHGSYSIEIGKRILKLQRFDRIVTGKSTSLFYITEQTEYLNDKNDLFIYKTFFDSITDQGIMVIDAEERIILLNTPASMYDELPMDIVLGKKFRDVYPEHKDSPILKTIKTGKAVFDTPITYTTIEGQKKTSFSCSYPIKKNGKTVGAIAVQRWHDGVLRLINKIIEIQTYFYVPAKKSPNNTSFSLEDIIGSSRTVKTAIEKAKKAGKNILPVLIYGETGTGKELFAQGIHNESVFKEGPFIAVNCAAIPDSLFESILFGSTKGAFTGAENTIGLFEQAEGGSIFLDELNSMPIILQAKILRVLQEKSLRKVGAKEEIQINCRIISAMNKPPLECIAENTLREDLYYRISAITITIPPLRERDGDVELLAHYFVQKYTDSIKSPSIKMLPDFLECLNQYAWPGNVRELQYIIESSLVMSNPGKDLSSYCLPNHLGESRSKEYINAVSSTNHNIMLKEELERTEKDIIMRILVQYKWNVSRSANALGLSRSNLQYRMNRLNISKPK